MPDTLMLAFQRPSDAAIACLRQFAKDNVHLDTDFEPVRELFRLGLVDRGARDMWITPLGRLVLAACDAQEQEDKWAIIEKAEDAAGGVFAGGLLNDLGADFAPDAPDPVGKVVEAARVYMSAQDDWANSLAYGVGHLTDRLEAGLQDARRNLRKVLDELDRATGKAGGKL